jgi:hypothetical protein
MEPTQCSETSAFNTQTPGKYPEDNLSLQQHGESLKTRKRGCFFLRDENMEDDTRILVIVILPNYGRLSEKLLQIEPEIQFSFKDTIRLIFRQDLSVNCYANREMRWRQEDNV